MKRNELDIPDIHIQIGAKQFHKLKKESTQMITSMLNLLLYNGHWLGHITSPVCVTFGGITIQ